MSRLILSTVILAAISFTLLAGSPPANPFRGEAIPEAEGDVFFKAGNYRDAATWYAGVAAADAKLLTDKQREAWAFCRVKLAAEALQKPDCDTAACAKDVAAAMELAPKNTEIQKLGQSVLALTRSRPVAPAPTSVASSAGGESVETECFTVRFTGSREPAEQVAKQLEASRKAIFERWSGPAGGAWSPRCEVVIHASAEDYSRATNQPVERTGHATVKLAEGKVQERRIDLRADDEGILANSLPRELTHVVLADLFPYTPPPKWAEEGMAVLAGSTEEATRYTKTMVKCAREGKLFTVAALLEMKDYPAAEKFTGFCCGSVSLVEYLVKLKGEKHFTTFLRDCQRYGSASALKRQYDFENHKALQDAWLKSSIK